MPEEYNVYQNGKVIACYKGFTLHLYNAAFTELVDQTRVGNLTELFSCLSSWQDY